MNAVNGINNTGANNAGINNNIGLDLVEILERLGQYFIENIVAICTMVVMIIGALVYQQIMYVQHGGRHHRIRPHRKTRANCGCGAVFTRLRFFGCETEGRILQVVFRQTRRAGNGVR